jgi:hypothetical protein
MVPARHVIGGMAIGGAAANEAVILHDLDRSKNHP